MNLQERMVQAIQTANEHEPIRIEFDSIKKAVTGNVTYDAAWLRRQEGKEIYGPVKYNDGYYPIMLHSEDLEASDEDLQNTIETIVVAALMLHVNPLRREDIPEAFRPTF